MNRWMSLSFGILCLALFAGCPFTAKVPLGEPGDFDLDKRLLGSWAGATGDGDSLRIIVLPFNRSEYYAELSEKEEATERYRMFEFQLGHDRFLQVNEVTGGASAPEYCFARCAFFGDSGLVLKFIGDKMVPKELADDARALSAFLEKHRSDPELDDAETALTLRRVE